MILTLNMWFLVAALIVVISTHFTTSKIHHGIAYAITGILCGLVIVFAVVGGSMIVEGGSIHMSLETGGLLKVIRSLFNA